MKSFRRQARLTIHDQTLQTALEKAAGRFREGRAEAWADLPGVDAMRDQLKQARAATLDDLPDHLLKFEQEAIAAGAQVHWARDRSEAAEIVIKVARDHGVSLVTKSKSMATEEIRLNPALERAGIAVVETDLGEWIVQLAEEPPSHIIAPAIHKTKEQVANLFTVETGREIEADIKELTSVAREHLRERFLDAGMGISGANFGVAETGSIVLVTNEGNGRMVTSLPKVHLAVMGIEKMAPTWDEAAIWLALLARSATGQPLSIYTNVITGPARPEDPDGPEEVHIILLDNNRSKYLGTGYQEVLECIRCGACLNVCPVYREVGGHAYGSPYSGPIGAVVSPLLFGMEYYDALPQASTLCGACLEVCPAKIDLPRMLLALRRDQAKDKLAPLSMRLVEQIAAGVLTRPKLYQALFRLARWLKLPALGSKLFRFPDPLLSERPFRDIWRSGEV